MPIMTPLSILLVGDTDRTEFDDARVSMERWSAVHRLTDVDAAAAAIEAGRIVPDVIVVAQAFPGQFSHESMERLRRLAPLARVLGLMGSWCEGEMRSGQPWLALRNYWYQWPARCRRELQQLAEGHGGMWALPPTATEEERLLADANVLNGHGPHPSPLPKGEGTCGLVAIRSPSVEMADWLSAACRRQGYATVRQREPFSARVEGATAAIFDAVDLSDAECDELKRWADALGPAPVIVLKTFPRIEHRHRVLAAGAAALLSKPVTVEDLFWQIEMAQQTAE